MNLFIRIKDGEPFEHPMLEDNFKQVFPSVDVDNLPPEFARFIRIPCPSPDPGKYIVSSSCTYEWVNNHVQDVWVLVQKDIEL